MEQVFFLLVPRGCYVLIVHRSNRKNEQFKQYDKINNYALADFGRYIIATIPENPTLDRSMLMQ